MSVSELFASIAYRLYLTPPSIDEEGIEIHKRLRELLATTKPRQGETLPTLTPEDDPGRGRYDRS